MDIADARIFHTVGTPDADFPVGVFHPDGPAVSSPVFHWHDCVEISYVRRGRGRYEIEDKVFDVEAGDVIVVNNVERHRLTFSRHHPLYETSIHFDPELLCRSEDDSFDARYLRLFLYHGSHFANQIKLPESETKLVGNLVARIGREMSEKRPGYELMTKSLLLTLVTTLMRTTMAGLDTTPAPGLHEEYGPDQVEKLERILSYIRAHAPEDLSLTSVADRFAMSSSYFSAYFHKSLGITFSRFVTQLRVRHAMRMLKDNDCTAQHVADACGFNSRTSLYRALKKYSERDSEPQPH